MDQATLKLDFLQARRIFGLLAVRMSERRLESRRVRWLFLGLAGAGLFHFAISLFCWCLGLYVAVRMENPRVGVGWSYFFYHASPAVILFAAFVTAFVLAWRFRPLAAPVTLVSILTAMVCFGYDARHANYQIQEMYVGTGCTHFYYTWWWYDDIHNPNR